MNYRNTQRRSGYKRQGHNPSAHLCARGTKALVCVKREQTQSVCRHSRNRRLLELIIGKWSVDMNKQLKKLMLVMTILLLAACGQFETTPAPADAPEFIVTETPTDAPEPVLISKPTENIPTTAPSDGVAPESFSQYIGLHYPPSPAGLSQEFSMLIQNSDLYSLSLVIDGANKMLWLSKVTQYDTNGSPNWEVKDVLGLSNLEAGLTLLPDGCRLNGVPASEIFVAGRNGVIILAWRANTTLGKFEVIPTDGIRCSSDKAMDIT